MKFENYLWETSLKVPKKIKDWKITPGGIAERKLVWKNKKNKSIINVKSDTVTLYRANKKGYAIGKVLYKPKDDMKDGLRFAIQWMEDN